MLKIFISAFTASIIFTLLAIKLATKFNILDIPSDRKVHTKATPLLGGVAIFGAYTLAILINFHFSWQLKGVIIASSLIMLSGLVDDIKELPAGVRLIVQIACSILVISFGVRLNIIPDGFPFAYWIEALITIIWIVGITNALNFLDGIDGLATGMALVAAATFFTIAYFTGQWYFAYLNIALSGACLGFLLFNFHNAKIFLGDAGSSFLGFSLAVMAVMGEWGENRPIVALSIPLLVLAILIFDMVYISISRITAKKVRNFKEWIEYVGKDHLHHRLMGIGFSQVQTVLFICLINIVFSLGALVLKKATTFQAGLLLLQGVLILIIVAVLMVVGRGNNKKRLLSENKLKGIDNNGLS